MKRLFFCSLIITLFTFSGNINAEVISIEGAKEIANTFFLQSTKPQLLKSSTTELMYMWDSNTLTQSGNTMLKSTEEDPTFYVFANSDGDGFVIVSGDDNTRQIIGYSFESSVSSADEIPDPMKDYLAGIDQEIKWARANLTSDNKKLKATEAETGGSVVKLIETATWGQNDPYNRQCFTNSGATAATGCIATAFAIVMKHHKWPDEGIGTLYNSQTGDIITDRTYNWNNMLMSYSGTYTDEQANEVAKVMSHIGHAYMVTYGTGSTGGNTGNSTDKMAKFFAYKDVTATYGSSTDQTAWIELIKESIQNDCPIPYESTNSGTGDSKHIFVLDGYTDNNYFHFNWGWNGYQNGYFTLSAMLPGGGDDYSGLSNHKAFFNFAPDREECTVTASVSPSNAGVVSINGGYAEGSVTHTSYENANITLSATAYSGYTFSNWSCNGEVISSEKSFQTKVSSTANQYTAIFLTVGTTKISIPVTYNTGYGTITYNGSTVSGTGITAKENQEVTLTATANSGYIFNGWTITSNGTTKNVTTKDITFIATNNVTVSADFSLALTEYVVSHATGTKTNASGARSSTWTYTTTTNNPVALQLTSTSGTTEVYGLSNSYDRYYAYAYDSSTNGYNSVTYTLSVPEGYVITGYDMTYWVSSSYKGQVTVTNDEGSNTPTNTDDQNLLASGLNTQTTSFTLSVSQTGQQYITIESFTVTIKKEGGEEPITPPTPTKYSVSVTAGVGGSATSSATEVEEGGSVTLTATPFDDYEFAGWSIGTSVISYENPYTATISANTEFIANFKEISSGGGVPDEVSYCTPSGNYYTDNYLTAITSSGAKENISYSAASHPGSAYFVLPDTIRVGKGNSFTLNLVAKSLGAGSNYTVREDIRYCHASLFTDFDIDGVFGSAITTWGNNPPTDNVYGNYDECMNISTEISVPASALLGTSHIRVIYTNAWSSFPDACTTSLDKGIAYDIVVNVTDLSGIEDSDSSFAKIYASDGVVYINGYVGNAKIINIAGQVVKDIFCNRNDQIEVDKGIYLVVTSEGVVKVII